VNQAVVSGFHSRLPRAPQSIVLSKDLTYNDSLLPLGLVESEKSGLRSHLQEDHFQLLGCFEAVVWREVPVMSHV
jgi:hypothetical protein